MNPFLDPTFFRIGKPLAYFCMYINETKHYDNCIKLYICT